MRSNPIPLTLSLVLVLSIGTGPARSQDDLSTREITTAFASPDSHARHETWKKLNPENSQHYKILLHILKKLSWYDRDGAIIALATAGTESTLKKMLRDLHSNRDPTVRQGLAVALAKMDDERYYPELFKALDDRLPAVRRMAVYWLGATKKSRDKVQALVDAFQNEDDPVVKSFFVNALNDQTQAFQGPDPRAWFTWWEEAKADSSYELGKTDEEALRKAEELGNKLKKRRTVSAAGGVTLETEERGSTEAGAVPILILPEYGHSKEVMVPFLSELETTHKLFYIDLPRVDSFKNLRRATERQIPYYPIEQLVKAFEDLRKETGEERFALMACGLNCWIAMKYASLYPESVSHMVLIGPVSSQLAFSKVVDRMKREGQAGKDIELWHLGMSMSLNSRTGKSEHEMYHEKPENPKPPDGEDAALDRRNWSLYFEDERDSTISMLYPRKSRPLGNVLIPNFRCFEEPRRNIPTIVIVGRDSLRSTVDDCKAIAEHYGGRFFVYPNSSMMPFCEESEIFNKHMSALLRERPRRR